jgi:hypothetical protein
VSGGDVDQAAGRCQEILQCHWEQDHAGDIHQAVAVADAPGQRVHEWRAKSWLDETLARLEKTAYPDRAFDEIEADAATYFLSPTSPAVNYDDMRRRLVHDVPGLLARIRLLLKQRREAVDVTHAHPGIGTTILGYQVTIDGAEYRLDPRDVVTLVRGPDA